MRRKTTPPYCHLETIGPVKHKRCNNKFKIVTVNKPYRFDMWHTASDLPELIRKFEFEIKQHGWKADARAGTVNGHKMRRVESDTYPDDQFTAKELKAPPGYRYWTCNPEEKTVTLLRMWDHDEREYHKKPKLWRRIAADPRYLPPLTVPMPEGWVVTYSKTQQPDGSIQKKAIVSGWLEDRNVSVKPSFDEAFAKLQGLLAGTVDWRIEQAFNWPEKDELVQLAFAVRRPRSLNKAAKFWQITGKTFTKADSPKVLYRAYHYFHTYKLDELYKGHLVRLYHPQGIAWADIGTWKCEMEIRLCADSARCKQLKSASIVRAGAPGSHSDEVSAPVEVMQWYGLLVKLLETKTMIYSGNNFEV